MTPAEQALLKRLMNEPVWELLVRMASELIDKYRNTSCLSVTEFETLQKTIQREAKMDVLREYLEIIERRAND